MRKVSNMTGSQRTLLTDPVDIDGDVARAPVRSQEKARNSAGASSRMKLSKL
jgi:hypothetical protein